jgi:signal transduction histidine kinase
VRETGTRKLSAPVELATYRIVQEALTNVVRHADAANVAVSVTCENDALIIEITDDGSIRDQRLFQDASAPRPGFGLIGMAERAAAVGGEVRHGPMPGGGFRVRAVLPLDGVPS